MAIAKPSADNSNPDKEVALYAETDRIHPRKVKGTFRTLKWWSMVLFLAFYHLAPFIRWDRGPGAPAQAILADIGGRRIYLFALEIWPQEIYYLTGLLFFAAVALFMMSAVAGRVWCGFMCFQTVYTDLFVAVERWIIGDRSARIHLDRKPWSADKFAKKTAVNLLWALIGASSGIGFTLFFGDAFQTLTEIFTGEAGGAIYGTIAVVGGCCYLLAGYGREQVCIYACPYSRFQSAMFDEHSLIISYEAWRGEPRAPARKGQSFEGRGHCIDCRFCIQVCPTGIDIREGNQLACIGCGLCIDACNGIMDRYGLPRGLISYDSTVNIAAHERGEKGSFKLIRPRTLVYTAILTLVGALMVVSLAKRTTLEVSILHERSPLYVQLGNGTLRNGYTYKVLNMIREDHSFTLGVDGIAGATVQVVGAEGEGLDVPGDSVGTFRVYVTAPESATKGKTTPLYFILTDKRDGHVLRSSALFAGPEAP